MNESYNMIEEAINKTRMYAFMPYPYNNPLDTFRGVVSSIEDKIDVINKVSIHLFNNKITKLIIEHDKGIYEHVFEIAPPPVVETIENTEEV